MVVVARRRSRVDRRGAGPGRGRSASGRHLHPQHCVRAATPSASKRLQRRFGRAAAQAHPLDASFASAHSSSAHEHTQQAVRAVTPDASFFLHLRAVLRATHAQLFFPFCHSASTHGVDGASSTSRAAVLVESDVGSAVGRGAGGDVGAADGAAVGAAEGDADGAGEGAGHRGAAGAAKDAKSQPWPHRRDSSS